MTPSLRYKHVLTWQKSCCDEHCRLTWYASYMLYDSDKLIDCCVCTFTYLGWYSRRWTVRYKSKDHKCFSAVLPPVFLIHWHTGGCWVRVWESFKGNVQIKTTHSKWELFVLIKNHTLTCRMSLHCCVFFSMSWFCATPLGLHWTQNTLILVSSYIKKRHINLVMPHFLVRTPLKWRSDIIPSSKQAMCPTRVHTVRIQKWMW